MKVSQVIRTIKTQPNLWVHTKNNDLLFSFEYQGYTFLKLNKDLGGDIKLINKSEGVHMVWDESDAVGSQLWSSVIMHYVCTHIINKQATK